MATNLLGTFPFGRQVKRCAPSASSSRRVLVLGAYPSALHVIWTPPRPYKRIAAIAVANEPEPFWNGAGEEAHIESWKRDTKWDTSRHGEVSAPGRFNGSSGVWVDENVLTPLGVARAEAWITDCLDTYRCSKGLAARIADTYKPFAEQRHLPAAVLLKHPTEGEIIREAVREHQPRLRTEFDVARPDVVVTLGNAALAVVRDLFPHRRGAQTRRLAATAQYGTPATIRVGDRDVELIPLAHPAAPREYQTAHRAWRSAKLKRSA